MNRKKKATFFSAAQRALRTVLYFVFDCVMRICLAAVYFLMVAPIGVFLKIIGKDPLDKKIRKKLPTYWIMKKTAPSSGEKLFSQY